MKNHVREARSALSAVHRHWDGELLKMIRANAPSRDTGPQPGAAANSLRLVLVVTLSSAPEALAPVRWPVLPVCGQAVG
jgi:hypothetical protein